KPCAIEAKLPGHHRHLSGECSMKTATRLGPWILALWLLVPSISNSTARMPQPQKPGEILEGKLPALLSAKPAQAEPSDDELRKLLKARYNAALAEAKKFHEFRELASNTAVELLPNAHGMYGRWQRLLHAALELYQKPTEKIALLDQYLDMTKDAEKIEQARFDAGRSRIDDLQRARYERLDAEIRLLRAKREADKCRDK